MMASLIRLKKNSVPTMPLWSRGEREWFFDFGNENGNCSTHSQILGTGTGMKNSIPNFWEQEEKNHSQFSGTGMGVENSIPDFRDGNWRPIFPGIPGIGNSRDIAIANLLPLVSELVSFRFLVSLHTA